MLTNVHERHLAMPPERAGALLDGLSGAPERLWPTGWWPAMRFDRPLGAGARGGHGPIRYRVEEYTPGEWVRFRFEAPAGFDGYHEYRVVPAPDGGTLLRHALVVRLTGFARVSWPLVWRPMHDALIEDSLVKAGGDAGHAPWSAWVRLLRFVARRSRTGGRTGGQAHDRVPASPDRHG